jgi:hypothetical protein
MEDACTKTVDITIDKMYTLVQGESSWYDEVYGRKSQVVEK